MLTSSNYLKTSYDSVKGVGNVSKRRELIVYQIIIFSPLTMYIHFLHPSHYRWDHMDTLYITPGTSILPFAASYSPYVHVDVCDM